VPAWPLAAFDTLLIVGSTGGAGDVVTAAARRLSR
jgi:hypothetical protein